MKDSTAPAVDQQRLVRHSCELCNRDGQLVCQTVEPKPANSNPDKYPQDPRGPWVFRYYLCRWHRAAWNRTRMDSQRKMTVVEYVDDATLLANGEWWHRRGGVRVQEGRQRRLPLTA